MPYFFFFFFIFLISNFSFPGTANFIGELLIFFSVFDNVKVLLLGLLVGSFLSTAYSLLLFLRVCGGVVKK